MATYQLLSPFFLYRLDMSDYNPNVASKGGVAPL